MYSYGEWSINLVHEHVVIWVIQRRASIVFRNSSTTQNQRAHNTNGHKMPTETQRKPNAKPTQTQRNRRLLSTEQELFIDRCCKSCYVVTQDALSWVCVCETKLVHLYKASSYVRLLVHIYKKATRCWCPITTNWIRLLLRVVIIVCPVNITSKLYIYILWILLAYMCVDQYNDCT